MKSLLIIFVFMSLPLKSFAFRAWPSFWTGSTAAVCDAGPTILAITQPYTTSLKMQFHGSNVFTITWEIRNPAGTILRNGSVSPGSSNLTFSYGALPIGNYRLFIAGGNCTGTSSSDFTIPVDPCLSSPTPGAVCDGGAVYLGSYNSNNYMTTPGGCTDAATPTCAGGTDTVTKKWSGGTVTTGLTNADTGPANSVTLSNSYADTDAAKFCENMVYSGYSDWFLGAKNEMLLLWTNRASMTGIVASYYWTSTEIDTANASRQSLNSGSQASNAKSGLIYMRCLRRM